MVTVAVVRSPRLPSAACVTWALSGTMTTSLPPVGASTVAGPVYVAVASSWVTTIVKDWSSDSVPSVMLIVTG